MPDNQVFHPPRWLLGLFLGLALIGVFAMAAGFVMDPHRASANGLLVSNYLVGLALGSLVLVATLYITGARWSVPLRRVPEALAAILPIAGLGLLAVLLGYPDLYAWSAAPAGGGENASPLRNFWLWRPFFDIRALVYLGVWLAFTFAILATSRRQDRTGEPGLTGRNVGLSAGFLVAFGVTCWLASSDWIMSLEPNWTSTIFGLYNFAGLFLSALAAVTLVVICLARVGPLAAFVTRKRLHDLGTLVFAFSSFWMYIWFCQYLLIWYTNHPGETVYLRRRWEGDWPAIMLLDIVLNWAIPFAVLLFRPAKRSPAILATICLIVLAGRWVDLFLMIFPSQGAAFAVPGELEAGFVLGAVGIGAVVVLRALGRAPLVPSHDPWLEA
jgi:hypothetical protein